MLNIETSTRGIKTNDCQELGAAAMQNPQIWRSWVIKLQIVYWIEVRKKFNVHLLQLKTTKRMNGLIQILNKWICQNERFDRKENASLSDPKSK